MLLLPLSHPHVSPRQAWPIRGSEMNHAGGSACLYPKDWMNSGSRLQGGIAPVPTVHPQFIDTKTPSCLSGTSYEVMPSVCHMCEQFLGVFQAFLFPLLHFILRKIPMNLAFTPYFINEDIKSHLVNSFDRGHTMREWWSLEASSCISNFKSITLDPSHKTIASQTSRRSIRGHLVSSAWWGERCVPRQCLSLLVTHFPAFVCNLGVWGWALWESHGSKDDRKMSFTQSMGIPGIKGWWVEVGDGVNSGEERSR